MTPTDNTIPNYAHLVITNDGGITQLNPAIDEESFGDNAARSETDVKLVKNIESKEDRHFNFALSWTSF